MTLPLNSADRPGREPARVRSRRSRAKASIHADYLDGVEGNHMAARRYRDLVNGYIVDLGGMSECSEIKLGLIRQLAITTIKSERLAACVVNGEEVDTSALCTLANTILKLSIRLGLERESKDVSPANYRNSNLCVDARSTSDTDGAAVAELTDESAEI